MARGLRFEPDAKKIGKKAVFVQALNKLVCAGCQAVGVSHGLTIRV